MPSTRTTTRPTSRTTKTTTPDVQSTAAHDALNTKLEDTTKLADDIARPNGRRRTATRRTKSAEARRAHTAADADSRVEQALADVPKKTRLERQAENGEQSYEKLVKAWLDGEQVAIKLYLDAEAKWGQDTRAWLNAETAYGRAVELDDIVRTSGAEAADHALKSQSFIDQMLVAMAEVKEGNYFRPLGFDKYSDYVAHVCKDYLKGIDGAAKKEVVRFVALQIPGLSQRKVEEITGVPQAQVSRALNGSTAGDGESGHGGDRTRTTKREVDKLEDSLHKFRSDQPEGKPDPLKDGNRWTDSELKRAETEVWAQLLDIRSELHDRGLPLAQLIEPEYGAQRSGTQGSVGGTTDASRSETAA